MRVEYGSDPCEALSRRKGSDYGLEDPVFTPLELMASHLQCRRSGTPSTRSDTDAYDGGN